MNFFALSALLTATVSISLGIFVYAKGSDKPLNRSLALFSLALCVWQFAQGIGAISAQPSALFWVRVQVGAAVFLPVFFLSFIYSLLGLEAKRKNVILGMFLAAAVFIALDFTPLFIDQLTLISGLRYFPKLTPVYGAFALWLSAVFTYGLVKLIAELRRSAGEQYRKLLFVFVAVLCGFLGGGTAFFPIFQINLPVVSHFALPVYEALAVYAIVKHGLIDITIYVRKGLVYSIITALFTAVYLLLLLLARNFSQRWAPLDSELATLFTLFGIGLIFQPLRDRSQAVIDHLFFKSQYDYQEAVKSFSEKLAAAVRLEELNELIRAGLFQFFKVKEAQLCFGEQAPPWPPVLAVAIESKKKSWGRLVLREKLSGDTYSEEDRRLLSTLASQIAIAFENIQLYRQLVRSESLAAMGTLAAGMAHEIKNPLAAIQAMTQILPENISDLPFLKKYTELVPRQLGRINRIVENLLKAGRLPKLERQATDVNEILHEALDLNVDLCRKQGIEINRSLEPLPKLEADTDQLRQVFVNLILNATQAMPVGGTLSVVSRQLASRIVIEIVDTGTGIPAEALDKIFEPFFTLKENGSGLGLFTAYRILEEHGGTIEAKSREGVETRFTIKLPLTA